MVGINNNVQYLLDKTEMGVRAAITQIVGAVTANYWEPYRAHHNVFSSMSWLKILQPIFYPDIQQSQVVDISCLTDTMIYDLENAFSLHCIITPNIHYLWNAISHHIILQAKKRKLSFFNLAFKSPQNLSISKWKFYVYVNAKIRSQSSFQFS